MKSARKDIDSTLWYRIGIISVKNYSIIFVKWSSVGKSEVFLYGKKKIPECGVREKTLIQQFDSIYLHSINSVKIFFFYEVERRKIVNIFHIKI